MTQITPQISQTPAHHRRGGLHANLHAGLILALLLLFAATLAACDRADSSEAITPVPTFTPTPETAPASVVSDSATGSVILPSATPAAAEAGASAPLTPTAAISGTVTGQGDAVAPAAPAAAVTPIALPDDLLAQGRELYRIGDYTSARSALETLLAQADLDVTRRLQAQDLLARALLGEGSYAEALAALDKLDADATAAGTDGADFVANDHFLRGRALLGSGDPGGAIASYWAFLDIYPWMAEDVQARIADAYISMNDTDSAAAALRRAADAAPDTVSRVRVLETLGQTYNDAARYSEAAAAYDEILAVAQNPAYRSDILYRAGTALSAAGDGAGAIDRWQSSATEAPDSPNAYLSLVELVNRSVDFDLYLRGYIDLQAEAYEPAISAYEAYLAGADASDARYADALHGLGLAYLGAENAAAAIPYFDRVIAEFAGCECFGQVWLDKARAEVATGDSAGARRTLRTFARDYPNDELAPQALWQSGRTALDEDNEVEAAIDFLSLAETFPQSARAADALYAVATGAWRRGFYGQAAETYARLQRDYPDYRWSAVAYWLGRALQSNGDDAGASKAWQSLVDKAPDIYYGVLAARSLKGLPETDAALLESMAQVAGPRSRISGDDGSQAFAEAWLKQWDRFANVANPGVLPSYVYTDTDLAKGSLLLRLDERGAGLDALERVYERYKDDPVALYPLALTFSDIGAYRESIQSMSRLLQFSPAGLVENGPIFMQLRAYPFPFRRLISQEALAHDMNPLLLASMIRQESLFEEGARSWAAAQGLAQIIPETARWVAEQQGHPDWTDDLIYRPYINVNFGAYYFDYVRDYLDGNEISALAGYNAGPGNALAWRERSGPDDTLFLEEITFSEPRSYIQLITENLYHYTRLYGE